MFFVWAVLPVLAMAGSLIYLYRRAAGSIRCFFPSCTKWGRRGRT